MTNSGKGWFDVISSDIGFYGGIHKWTIKCLKTDSKSEVCIGVITKTDFQRKEDVNLHDAMSYKEIGDGCLLFLPIP